MIIYKFVIVYSNLGFDVVSAFIKNIFANPFRVFVNLSDIYEFSIFISSNLT